MHGNVDAVISWLDAEAADANIVNARCTECVGMTLLIGSAIGGQKALILLLLQRQADIEMQDTEGHSALMAATEHGQTAAVAALLKSGASTELRDTNDGETALMVACSSGHSAIVHMLLRAGATADAKDAHGATILELAARRGHAAVLKLLCKALSSGPDGAAAAVRALILSAVQGHSQAVEMLLRSTGVRADACDSQGLSALQAARIEGHAACVELLERSLAPARPEPSAPLGTFQDVRNLPEPSAPPGRRGAPPRGHSLHRGAGGSRRGGGLRQLREGAAPPVLLCQAMERAQARERHSVPRVLWSHSP